MLSLQSKGLIIDMEGQSACTTYVHVNKCVHVFVCTERSGKVCTWVSTMVISSGRVSCVVVFAFCFFVLFECLTNILRLFSTEEKTKVNKAILTSCLSPARGSSFGHSSCSHCMNYFWGFCWVPFSTLGGSGGRPRVLLFITQTLASTATTTTQSEI